MADMEQTWFVDIAAVRIQTWLARSARVRYRRGASFRLAGLTSPEALRRVLPAGGPVVPNDEAGQVSGVASVRFPGAGLTEPEARAIALEAALAVARHLRGVFPALPLQALWGRGKFYVEAYAGDMMSRPPLLDLPALTQEGVASRPCGMCRSARAVYADVSFVKEAQDKLDLCIDCHSRVRRSDGADRAVAGWVSANDSPSLLEAQKRLHADLQKATGEGSFFPNDFGDLATWIPKAEGDAATQLCTIFADGNRIGVLMKEVANHLNELAAADPSATAKRPQIVAGLTVATRRSVAAAAQEAADIGRRAAGPAGSVGLQRVPALVHLADGDDVLMTVPAPAGWGAARRLGSTFAQELKAHIRDAGIPEDLSDFSLSMGMVFHHESHPFADVVAAAEELLAAAKKQEKGRRAAIAFLDLTADGETSVGVCEAAPDQPRRAVTLEELDAWAAALTAAADVDAAQRANLLQMLREATAEANSEGVTSGPGGDGETARQALARRVATMGERRILALVGGSTEGAELLPQDQLEFVARVKQIRAQLEGNDPMVRDELRLHLDVARWWPPGCLTVAQGVVETAAASSDNEFEAEGDHA
ncbi:MAG: hypothetical protein KBF43_08895 [Dermatophilaceae bacterium]|nr:hypothetical protein [Dermatophilaceae bacterium]MBP9918688.1 hypothetical protein [Dermatophilaceae bacterium]